MLKVYLVQMESKPNQVQENLNKARTLIETAAPDAGSLILLPEMFATGYLPAQAKEIAQSFDQGRQGEVSLFLSNLAQTTRCFIFGGCTKIAGDRYTNHTGIFTPDSDGEAAGYDKIHPFFPEQEHYTAGERITLFKINDFTIAPSICFDLRFPEQYRDSMKAGADLFAIQAAWPAIRKDHWETLLKARAIENQCYVAAVNCVAHFSNGTEITDKVYSGDSQILSPLGEILAIAPAGKECVVSAELNIEPLRQYRQKFPVTQVTYKYHT